MGEIYEKYNQPGKRMAPELRLLLMVSGAGLSLQMNKVVPKVASQVMPGMSNLFKNNTNNSIDKLRQKAAETSEYNRTKLQEQTNLEHDAVAQRISDIEMLKQKEMEYKQMSNQMNNSKLQNDLILSSESAQQNNEIEKLEQENLKKKLTIN